MTKVKNRHDIAKANIRSKTTPCIVHTLEHVDHRATSKGFSQSNRSSSDLKKRAKNAYFSKSLAAALSNLDSPLRKAYRTTLFDCCSHLMQEGKTIKANMYCGYRWCNVCNRIRTGKLMNGYLHPLQQMKSPYFVTVTVPNVREAELRDTIKGMIKQSSLAVRSLKRLKIALNGIRKIESTYNYDCDTYHPHLHFIIDGEVQANAFVSEWLARYPKADKRGQKTGPVTDDAGGIKELFKYTTKIVSKSKIGFNIYVPALDAIFTAMKGIRTFQSFGNIKRVDDDITDIVAENYDDIEPYEFVVWQWEGNDWQNMGNGSMLTNYKPSKAMIDLLTEKMVT